MKKAVKFATQVQEDVLDTMRAYAKENGQSLSSITTEAIREYLSRRRVRSKFLKAMHEVIEENHTLLDHLAK
jgi:hypothetical protein